MTLAEFDQICYEMIRSSTGRRFTWREIVTTKGGCVLAYCNDLLGAGQDYQPGLYSILDAAGRVIYVGKSLRIAGRLADHAGVGEFSSKPSVGEAVAVREWLDRQKPYSLDYEVGVWNLPHLLETYLIRSYRPTFNKKENEAYFMKRTPVGGPVQMQVEIPS